MEIGTKGIFVDRGDFKDWDFSVSSFQTDALVHDLDLSSVVPSNAKAALIAMIVKDNAINSQIFLFPKNAVAGYRYSIIYTQAVDISISHQFVVPLRGNPTIQYWATNTVFTEITLAILGWWI